MDPELIALLARLAELTDDELAELGQRLEAYFAEVDSESPSAEDAALLNEIADASEQVAGEVSRREGLAAEAAASAEAARRRMAGDTDAAADGDGDDTPGDNEPGSAEPDADQTDGDGDGDNPQAGDGDNDPAARTAAGPRRIRRAPQLGAIRRPAGAAPEDAGNGPARDGRVALVAAADVRGFGVGQEIPDLQALGEAMAARIDGLRQVRSGDGEPVLVASFRYDVPDARRLVAGNPELNDERIRAVLEDEAVVAAGGLCAPLNLDYTIPEVGDLDRPFRDSLANFNADRGGIRFMVPPSITDADAAVGFWTIENDEDPGGAGVPVADQLATKPVLEFDCGDEDEAYVYAATLRMRFNNIRARFNPETVASNTRLGLVSHARLSELRLMALMDTKTTAVTTTGLLGASKDLFGVLDVAVARFRYRQRLRRETPLHAWFPEWVRDMIRADFVRQMPAGDIEGQYALADELLNRMFAARRVNVTWTIEDSAGGAAGGIGAAQAAGALLQFPDTVKWRLAREGEFLFLNGGTLDLGVVRDSALNAVNKYETFFESFEGLAFRGTEALTVTSTLEPNGSAAGLVNTATVDQTAVNL